MQPNVAKIAVLGSDPSHWRLASPITRLDRKCAMQRLRCARTCYDHLAGRLGVTVTDALSRVAGLQMQSGAFVITEHGKRFFHDIGIDLHAVGQSRRGFSRACMDSTERRHHLAGALGAALLNRFVENEWVQRHAGRRSLEITTRGRREIARIFQVDIE